jgi:hypothetical protein
MAYNAYVVHGSKDGTIGVYTSWAKATERALNYCGGGDTASAEIIRFLAQ